MSMNRRQAEALAGYWRDRLTEHGGDGAWDGEDHPTVAAHFNDDIIEVDQGLTIQEYRAWLIDEVWSKLNDAANNGTLDHEIRAVCGVMLQAMHDTEVIIFPERMAPYINLLVDSEVLTPPERQEFNRASKNSLIIRLTLSPPANEVLVSHLEKIEEMGLMEVPTP